MNLKPRMHVLMAQQFRDTAVLVNLFQTANRLIASDGNGEIRDASVRQSLAGGVMYEIFYEPSTRTRFSFWAAAEMLGMSICASESAGQFSSAVKGETLEHTIRVLAGQNVQVIVIRHPETGAAQRAAAVVDRYYPGKVSIINAGDGRGQHPTQALLDVYTIWRKLGRVDGITVVVGGDLANGRTCRSLAYLLSKFSGVRLIFVSPPELGMGEDIIAHLDESGVSWRVETDFRSAFRSADVVYWTRVQKERLSDPGRFAELRDVFHIGLEEVSLLKPGAILMHPLPIAGEISPDVDDHPQAAYFAQANNGQFVRAALLMHIFGVSA
jgi:aspartate carbamoyltransferase catalytic subunit